jgi:hypothetical protein
LLVPALQGLWCIGLLATVAWVLGGEVLFYVANRYGIDGFYGVAGYVPSGEVEYWVVSCAFLGIFVGSSWLAFGRPWRLPPVVVGGTRGPDRMVLSLCAGVAWSWLIVGVAASGLELFGWWQRLSGWDEGATVWKSLLLAVVYVTCARCVWRCGSYERSLAQVRMLHIGAVMCLAFSVVIEFHRVRQDPLHIESHGAYTGLFLGWCVYLWSARGCAVLIRLSPKKQAA